MKELFNLNEDIREFKNVIIYGCGEAGQKMLLKLLQRNIKVSCFADTAPGKVGTFYLNVPVTHINDLLVGKADSAVIACGRHMDQIMKELTKLGFKHLFYDYGNDVDLIHVEKEVWI
jgi:NADH/NAD ratio-sensing transcriptional regulator Rex